jgi:RNA polymerase sigma-70 factor (ECF subfamily)
MREPFGQGDRTTADSQVDIGGACRMCCLTYNTPAWPRGSGSDVKSHSFRGEHAAMIRSNTKRSTESETNMSWKYEGPGHADGAGIEYIDGLYGYAVVLTRNHAEAEDLVQETYVRAIQAIGKLRPGSNMKGWLFTILRNIWLNQLRKVGNGPRMVALEAGNGVANSVAEPSKNSHDLYVTKIETEQVRAAFQELQTEFREIILLRDYEGLSYQKIASLLDCPVGTVMSRLGRARAKLRTLVAPTFKRSSSSEMEGTK